MKVIDDTRSNAKRFPTNGICERYQNTVFDEFYRVAIRNKIDKPLDELQTDLDGWLRLYNGEPTRRGEVVLWKNSDANVSR